MSLRIKLVLVGVLLFLALGTTAIAAGATYQAFQRLQQQNALAKVGDVQTIRPWMTIPYIAHMYHVPERYLYTALHLPANSSSTLHHTTLHVLSSTYKRPVNDLIRDIQNAIKAYRKQHPGNPEQRPPSRGHYIYTSHAPGKAGRGSS
ncbi:MAG: hypothetical protein ABI456_01670 [Ktedonobacteraceae bacterium]|nr:hypothetical protein [Chloroflexota bacterium]